MLLFFKLLFTQHHLPFTTQSRILVGEKYLDYSYTSMSSPGLTLPHGRIIYVNEILEASRHVLAKNVTLSTLHTVMLHSVLSNYIIVFVDT